ANRSLQSIPPLASRLQHKRGGSPAEILPSALADTGPKVSESHGTFRSGESRRRPPIPRGRVPPRSTWGKLPSAGIPTNESWAANRCDPNETNAACLPPSKPGCAWVAPPPAGSWEKTLLGRSSIAGAENRIHAGRYTRPAGF